jgi:peptide/nickel transport system substrate-binding protein
VPGLTRVPLLFGLAALLTLTACAQPSRTTPAAAPDQPQGQAPAAPQAPKVLTIVQLRELGTFEGYTGAGGGGGGADVEGALAIGHLVVSDAPGHYILQLARELPAVDKGTWRVNADGSMDVTWKVHPNAKWHDGTPFSTADLAFAWRVNRDPEMPTASGSIVSLMESVSTPDATTFEVHWSKVYKDALLAVGLTPLPRHLLEDLYTRDKQAFVNSSYFTTDYVGLGPYKLAGWTPGSHTEYVRFDDFYLGKPKLDRVVVRYIGDPNTTLANLMAGEADVALPLTVTPQGAVEIRQRWQGTKNQVVIRPQETAELLVPQYRPDGAMPKQFGPAHSAVVRQALIHALDRQAIAEVVTSGLSPVADSWISSQNVVRGEVERSIPQYPYDVAKAQQLLAQAGWMRGGDGVLVHQQSGERFELPLWSRPATGGEQELLMIADNFKAVGIDSSINVISGAQASDRSYEATRPGLSTTKPGAIGLPGPRLYSKEIASESNRWSGENKFAYSNPRFDALVDRFLSNIDPKEEVNLQRQMVQEVIGEAGILPIYWYTQITIAREGVSVGNGHYLTMFDWTKQ